jgi:membrane protease YdiL (CAAX protease family)
MIVRTLVLLEPFAIFGSIMAYIWRFRFAHPWFCVPVVGAVILSHVARRERATVLGFRMRNLGDCVRSLGPILIALAFVMSTAGVLLGTIRPMGFENAAGSLALYLPWGLFQQYLLNGYFLKRFETALSPSAADLTTAALFSAVHSPNWFLMLVTPVAGYGAVQVYRRYSNLYFLGLAHAVIGFLLFLVVPDSISHHLNVGPGWSPGH